MVDDDTLHADYIAMAPGGKTPRRMNTDTREWWAVQDGQIRFSIDGRSRSSRRRDISCRFHIEPSTRWRLLAIDPSLRLEVNIAKARKMYPLNTTPVPEPGVEYVVLALPARELTRVETNR